MLATIQLLDLGAFVALAGAGAVLLGVVAFVVLFVREARRGKLDAAHYPGL